MIYKELKKEDLTDKVLANCANWWFDIFIGKDQFKDNGAKEFSSVMAGSLAGMVAEDHPVNEDQRQPFIDAFAGVCHDWLEKYEKTSIIRFGCDYNPDFNLGEAMEKAGVDPSRAPWKTNMSIGNLYQGPGVSISSGYAASHEHMWDLAGEEPAKRWVIKYTSIHPEYEVNDYKHEHTEFECQSEYYGKDEFDDFVLCSQKTPGSFNGIPDAYNRITSNWTEEKIDGEWVGA